MTEFVESKSGLMIPKSTAGKTVHGCTVCGYQTADRMDMERHVVRCADDNADRIRNELSPRQGPNDPENWDTEYEDWLRGGARKWDNWHKEHGIERTQEDYGR